MEDISFLNTLKMKYNYSDKLTTALDKIIPKLIAFYGEEYKNLIQKAIASTRIIECNSYQPLSSVIKTLNPTPENKDKALIKENLKLASSVYLADPVIIYDDFLKTYIIKDIKRYIVLSHFHNLDSPRGLATLTHELSKLVRSYTNEFKIENDILTQKTGLKLATKQINKENNQISLVLLNEQNTGLEAGINSYDEEKITSSVIGGKYETFDYNLPKKVALILYERLRLKPLIVSSSILGNNHLQNEYDLEPGIFDSLTSLVDQAILEEEKNSNSEITKEEKEIIKEQLARINQEIGNNIIFYINANAIIHEPQMV